MNPRSSPSFLTVLETGDASARDTEHLEKLVVEGLALAFLVMGGLPFVGEACGSCSDLVPAKTHSVSSSHHRPFKPVPAALALSGRRGRAQAHTAPVGQASFRRCRRKPWTSARPFRGICRAS